MDVINKLLIRANTLEKLIHDSEHKSHRNIKVGTDRLAQTLWGDSPEEKEIINTFWNNMRCLWIAEQQKVTKKINAIEELLNKD